MPTPWLRSNWPLWLTAVVSGLIVAMLIAVVSPEVFAREAPGWTVSLLAGLLTAAAIVVWAYARRKGGQAEEHPPAQ